MKLRAWWETVRDGLWFTPTVLALAAAALAVVMVRIDIAYATPERIRELWWLFGGSPDGARGVLTAIAGSLITVTGVVFSITIVALQLASSQFTPRLLRNFMSDRGNQLVLGVFIGTFTYTLLILRTVRSPIGEETPVFLPAASVTMAVALALVSMGFLIFYIDHIASWIEASSIVDRVAGETLEIIRKVLPLTEEDVQHAAERELPDAEPGYVLAHRSGYVQLLNTDRIYEIADGDGITIRIEAPVGHFVLEAGALASIWPKRAMTDELASVVREAFVIGHRRTLTQDVELGVVQLSDIAVKALSPGINDPTTAVMCLERLGEVVSEIGRRHPRHVLRDDRGALNTILPRFEFERVVDVAFSQIRRYGATDPVVTSHLLQVIRKVGHRVGGAEREVLRQLVDSIEVQAEQSIDHPEDLERLRGAARSTRRYLRGDD